MIIKKLLLILPIFCFLFCCSQPEHKNCILTGDLKNIKDGTILNLLDVDSDSVIQKMMVKDGKFKAELNLPKPRYFAIYSAEHKLNENTHLVWLKNADILIHGNFNAFWIANVKGSESNKIKIEYSKLTKTYAQTWQELQKTKDIDSQKIHNLQNEYKSDLLNFYSTHNKDYVAFYFLAMEIFQFLSPLSKSDIENLYLKFPEDFKNSSKGETIEKYLSLGDPPKIGEKFIDCTLQTPEGLKDSISGHMGRYTLIHFWASTCQPSRGDFSILKEIYYKYRDEGLNMIGISGDTKRKEWENAIHHDSIPWVQISDLQGYNNEAFMIYGVKNIPTLILLNQDGLLLNNNISRSSLPTEMKKIFESKLFIFPIRNAL